MIMRGGGGGGGSRLEWCLAFFLQKVTSLETKLNKIQGKGTTGEESSEEKLTDYRTD